MINIKSVSKSFKHVKAVQDISLDIYNGEFFALLGPNGAGKTTLVEMIEGLQHPDKGEIIINGLNWKNNSHQIRKILGISLQESRFLEKVTVKEILDLFGSFYHLPRKRSDELIELVNLQHKKDSFTINLSGGQRQRLALAIALLNEPQILILDEPTTGLDPNSRREIWDLLLDLKRKQKTTLILTTHYMEEAERLCDRIVIMDQGKILAQGSLKELLAKFSAGEIITFKLNRRVKMNLSDLEGICKVKWFDNKPEGIMEVDEIAKTLPKFLDLIRNEKIDLLELESHKKTLDDLFISMTGRRLNE